MAAALRPADTRIAGDYRVTVEHARGITCARVITGDESIAASGQAAVTGETCVFDQIETAPEHRRRGLGSAVMAALTTSAIDLGAATGILGAIVPGRALYESLSWEVIGPLNSFCLQARQHHHRPGLPLGLVLFKAAVHGGTLPPATWLIAAVLGTLAAIVALTIVPA